MPLLMIRQDITKMNVDAVVNPSNPRLQAGRGTSNEIFAAAGRKKLEKACQRIGHCEPESAVITKGYNLPAKYIIHTAGPVWDETAYNQTASLYNTYTAALELAKEHKIKSIAFPLLSSGSYRYPKNIALKAGISAISDFLMENDMTVYMVVYDKESLNISKKLFESVREYIDDNYVEKKNAKANDLKETRIYTDVSGSVETTIIEPGVSANNQYGTRNISDEKSSKPTDISQILEADEWLDYDDEIFDSVPNYDDEIFDSAPNYDDEISYNTPNYDDKISNNGPSLDDTATLNLDELLKKVNETFSDMLLRLIDESGMTDAQVYKKANIDRRLFSKIRSNSDYKPTKKTALAFAIALELSYDKTQDLLMKAGYTFSNASKFDVIVAYFIVHGKYDIFEINEVLFYYEQPIIGGV